MYNTNIAKIEKLLKKKNVSNREYTAILKIIKSELKKQPENAWLLAQMSCVLYELKQYRKALEVIDKALNLSPYDPLYLWYSANALDMLDEQTKAIGIYKKIIKMGFYNVGCIETGEGVRWAKSLINDCKYRIGLCYNDLNKKKFAIKWINEHLSNRQPGFPSVYDVKEVRRKVKEIESN